MTGVGAGMVGIGAGMVGTGAGLALSDFYAISEGILRPVAARSTRFGRCDGGSFRSRGCPACRWLGVGWIPACAGMTGVGAGMVGMGAGMVGTGARLALSDFYAISDGILRPVAIRNTGFGRCDGGSFRSRGCPACRWLGVGWIPACAGMTGVGAGMVGVGAGMVGTGAGLALSDFYAISDGILRPVAARSTRFGRCDAGSFRSRGCPACRWLGVG